MPSRDFLDEQSFVVPAFPQEVWLKSTPKERRRRGGGPKKWAVKSVRFDREYPVRPNFASSWITTGATRRRRRMSTATPHTSRGRWRSWLGDQNFVFTSHVCFLHVSYGSFFYFLLTLMPNQRDFCSIGSFSVHFWSQGWGRGGWDNGERKCYVRDDFSKSPRFLNAAVRSFSGWATTGLWAAEDMILRRNIWSSRCSCDVIH